MEQKISFRKVEDDDDIALVHEWHNAMPAEMFRGIDASLDAFRERILAELSVGKNSGPVEHWMILLDGEAAGWTQTFRALDFYSTESSVLRPFLDLRITGVFDWVIRPETRGQGHGGTILRSIFKDIIFGRNSDLMIVSNVVQTNNIAAKRVAEKIKMQNVGSISDEDGNHIVYAIHREEFMGLGAQDLTRNWDDDSTCGSYENYDFDELPEMKQKLVITLGYTPEQWDSNGQDEPSVCKIDWCDLPTGKKSVAKKLGFNEMKWDVPDPQDYDNINFKKLPECKQKLVLDLGFTPEQWDNSDLDEPSICETSWCDLPLEQKLAAEGLGYDEEKWDASSSESDTSSSSGSVTSETSEE